MKTNLPVYQIIVNEENIGLYAIAFVKRPAVEVDWLAFSKEDETQVKFSVDETQHRVLGVVMRPDFLIYRRDKDGNGYYMTVTKEEIKHIVRLFLQNGFQNLVNVEHNDELWLNGVELEQIFIKDVATGINPVGFEDIEDGALFFQYHITDEEVWRAVQDGVFKGLSIEGFFDLVPVEKEVESVDELLEILNIN